MWGSVSPGVPPTAALGRQNKECDEPTRIISAGGLQQTTRRRPGLGRRVLLEQGKEVVSGTSREKKDNTHAPFFSGGGFF